MKKLFLLLLLLPCISFAQTFNLSLGGGFIPKSGDFPKSPENFYIWQGNEDLTPFTVALRGIFRFRHFEAGIGAEVGKLQRAAKMPEDYFENLYFGRYDINYASSFITPYVFGNGILSLGSGFSIYGGLTGGFYCPIGEPLMTAAPKNRYYTFYGLVTLNGFEQTFLWGMQAGVRYTIVKGFQVYMEFAGRTSMLQASVYGSENQQPYRLWYFPVTAGLSVRLAKW